MVRNISVILLSLLVVWYAALQVRSEKASSASLDIQVPASERMQETFGDEIYGQIRATAALRRLSEDTAVTVCFVLEGNSGMYTREVTVTPECWDENDLLSASAVFMDLRSGLYTLRIGYAENAELDYILAEDGDESKYMLEGDTICFELSESARLGSAWFILSEPEENNR